jgi:hypothetical protein
VRHLLYCRPCLDFFIAFVTGGWVAGAPPKITAELWRRMAGYPRLIERRIASNNKE